MSTYRLIKDIDSRIFRAYDIRGTTPQQLNEHVLYTIGRSLGSFLFAKNIHAMNVARDGRVSGPALVKALIAGLTDSGISVIDRGLCTSPLLYFSTVMSEITSGVILTGSHNPPEDNGLKIVVAGRSLLQEELMSLHQKIIMADFVKGHAMVKSEPIYQPYIRAVQERVHIAKKLKIVIDCGNGAAGVIAKATYEALGLEVIALYEEIDGRFPNHQPDPSVPQNLVDLQAAVIEYGADLGLAFDGDGDRVGIVDEKGDSLFADRLLMLLADNLLQESPQSAIVYDIKCTNELPKLIDKMGGVPVLSPTGHSLVKAKMKDIGAALAGEMSGHIFYQHRWFGFDDGVYTGARVLEILAKSTEDFSTLMRSYPKLLSTPEIKVAVDAAEKFKIVEQLKTVLKKESSAKISTVDGVRIDYDDGWALVRASNTTENLTLRFEAESNEKLERLMALIESRLTEISPTLAFLAASAEGV